VFAITDFVYKRAKLLMDKSAFLREKTKQFALEILRATQVLKDSGYAVNVLVRQLIRSATSVGANYREACRARSRAEFVSKLGVCLMELDESDYWIELLIEMETETSVDFGRAKDECHQLLSIFTTIRKRVQAAKTGEYEQASRS
jgi:four helix bundle protein